MNVTWLSPCSQGETSFQTDHLHQISASRKDLIRGLRRLVEDQASEQKKCVRGCTPG